MVYDFGPIGNMNQKYPGVYVDFKSSPTIIPPENLEGVVAIPAYPIFNRVENTFPNVIDIIPDTIVNVFNQYVFAEGDLLRKVVEEAMKHATAVRLWCIHPSRVDGVGYAGTVADGNIWPYGMDVDGCVKITECAPTQAGSLANYPARLSFFAVFNGCRLQLTRTATNGVTVRLYNQNGTITNPTATTINGGAILPGVNSSAINSLNITVTGGILGFTFGNITFKFKYLKEIPVGQTIEIVLGGGMEGSEQTVYGTGVVDRADLITILDEEGSDQRGVTVHRASYGIKMYNYYGTGFFILARDRGTRKTSLKYLDMSNDRCLEHVIVDGIDGGNNIQSAIAAVATEIQRVKYGNGVYQIANIRNAAALAKSEPGLPPKGAVKAVPSYGANYDVVTFSSNVNYPTADNTIAAYLDFLNNNGANVFYPFDWKYLATDTSKNGYNAVLGRLEAIVASKFIGIFCQLVVDQSLAVPGDTGTPLADHPVPSHPSIIEMRSRRNYDSEIMGAWMAGVMAGTRRNRGAGAFSYDGSCINPVIPSMEIIKQDFTDGCIGLHMEGGRVMIYSDRNGFRVEKGLELDSTYKFTSAYERNTAVRIVSYLIRNIRQKFINDYYDKTSTVVAASGLRAFVMELLNGEVTAGSIDPIAPTSLIVKAIPNSTKVTVEFPMTITNTAEQLYVTAVV
jgi:hypothetical protein